MSKSIDLSYHFSDLANSRQPSALKSLQKYIKPGAQLIQLAGGMPHPEIFAFDTVSAKVPSPTTYTTIPKKPESGGSWLWNWFGSSKDKSLNISIPKFPADLQEVNLAEALQYGPTNGLRQIQTVMKDFSGAVYQPLFTDFTTMISIGNTDAWNRVVLTFCNPGDFVIVGEWTYATAVGTMKPYGVKPVPVKLDSQGITATSLRELLSTWDETHPGTKRPHLMYTVPIGQNPTGATMGAERKKAIYDVCVEYDVIICEDDPYFFLQLGDYVSKDARKYPTEELPTQEYINSLAPSFLKFDYQGRVIRLDTFSKTIAPGCRMGWMTCSPLFAEHLERQGETTTQQPCGFGQALVCKLLQTWKHEGYIRWLQGLTARYAMRRDNFLDYLYDEFEIRHTVGVEDAWKGLTICNAHPKIKNNSQMSEKYSQKSMFSFVPPTSGMFVWMNLHFENMSKSLVPDEELSLEQQLFVNMAGRNVMVAPGAFFSGATDGQTDPTAGHFRLSFSAATPDDMKKAFKIMDEEMRKFFN